MLVVMGVLLAGCGQEASGPPAPPTSTPAPEPAPKRALAPVPDLPDGALLAVADRQTGIVHRFWADGRWEAQVPGVGWVEQEPRPPQRPWTGRMHPDGVTRLTDQLSILEDVPASLEPPANEKAPILPGRSTPAERHPVVFVGRLPSGEVRTVSLQAHFDRPDSFGVLQPLWGLLDEVAFGSRFDG